jgi:predicted XRE-type DNA-binding protein
MANRTNRDSFSEKETTNRANVSKALKVVDETICLTKTKLAYVVQEIIRQKGWPQGQAAKVLGIAPSDMSDLMRGKLTRFSHERLERFLNALNMDIHIRITPGPANRRQASVTVELVSKN